MANNTTTTLTGQYQNYFSRELLDYAIQELHLNEFAQMADLPKNVGGTAISFFRYGAGASSNVQTLTEGITPTTTRDLALTKINATLTPYGELAITTDILGLTELFDALKQAIKSMGEDAALNADDISRNELVSAGTKRYAQNAATFAALGAAGVSASKWIATDGLDVATVLKVQRAKTFQGQYVAVIPPQISRDVMNDPDWIKADNYAGSKKIFKGEIGILHGVRYVEATNPFREDSGGAEGTNVAAGDIFSTMYLGTNAFGVPKLSGDKPMSPRVYIVRGADKNDPLDQTSKAGWKAFYTAKSLNENWYRVYKSRSAHVA